MSKNFTAVENPALAHISESTKRAVDKNSTASAPEGYKLNPMYVEKRTARAQLLFQPSVKEKATVKAKSMGLSFSDYVHKLVEADLEK